MIKYKVVITDYEFDSLDIEKEELDRINVELVSAKGKTEEEFIATINDADGILNMYYPISRRLMEHMPRCKIIARYGVGVDNIDISAATELGIMVTNVPRYCINEASDHTLAFLLCLARKIDFLNLSVHSGIWDFKISQPIYRLQGKVLGLVGFGKIGQEVCKKASVFGLKILVYDPYIDDETIKRYQCERVPFDFLLTHSDFISIHCPLTEETKRMLSYKEFERMKRHAFLINTSRGGIVDNEALYKALEEKTIAGAAIDVIENVPPLSSDHPLLKLDNLLITPHSAWYSEESIVELRRTAVQEVVRVLNGQDPLSLVNPKVKEKRRK